MTNVVIDSILYGKIEDIGNNRGVKTDFWSKYEIEGFLIRRPKIRKKYFTC